MMRAKAPDPPLHVPMRKQDRPFWESIVRARDYNSWNAIDLSHAANLAKCQSDIFALYAEIEVEGNTLKNDRGTVVINPKHNLLEVLSRRSVALSRLLHVHAEATVGESRHQKPRAKKQQETNQIIEEKDNNLIPGAVH